MLRFGGDCCYVSSKKKVDLITLKPSFYFPFSSVLEHRSTEGKKRNKRKKNKEKAPSPWMNRDVDEPEPLLMSPSGAKMETLVSTILVFFDRMALKYG